MQWIDLEYIVPTDDRIILCCDVYNNFISMGRYLEDEEEFLLMNIENVEIDTQITHWMPLPPKPEILK